SAIKFSSMLLSQSGSPSQMGGSLPGGSIFSSGLVLGDWAIDNTTFVAFGDGTSPGNASFFAAFNGLVLEPGHSVNFPYATIKVPSGLAPGSDATAVFAFSIFYANDIFGSTGIGSSQILNSNGPIVKFITADTPSTVNFSSTQACVWQGNLSLI